jgi:hypothetical protein
MLLTSQVGGVGLTLTAANRVVILDPSWTNIDNQAVDRVYRIGQRRNVVVYRLITVGTVEEKIYRRQVFKQALLKSTTEKENQFRYFGDVELSQLFTLGDDFDTASRRRSSSCTSCTPPSASPTPRSTATSTGCTSRQSPASPITICSSPPPSTRKTTNELDALARENAADAHQNLLLITPKDGRQQQQHQDRSQNQSKRRESNHWLAPRASHRQQPRSISHRDAINSQFH